MLPGLQEATMILDTLSHQWAPLESLTEVTKPYDDVKDAGFFAAGLCPDSRRVADFPGFSTKTVKNPINKKARQTRLRRV